MNEIKLELVPVENNEYFFGIKIKEDKIKLYVPKIYRENSNLKCKNREILMYLKSLSLAKTLNSENIESSDNDFVGEMWPIDSYLWIIKDFLENGYFYNWEKKYFKDNKGKIDWKKTLKTAPVYSDGNIIYNKLITFRTAASNDIIAHIYRLCLSIAIKRIGWIFNFNFKIDVQQYITNKEMIYTIQKEINSTFEDVKRLRYRHVLKILKEIKNDNALSSYSTYGVKKYHYVVERMIDKMFKGIDEKKLSENYYPRGYWNLGFGLKETSLLRPDTIYEKKDKVYIIDSKMYKYGYTANSKDLPQTSDILKQITYGDFVKNDLGYKNVRNVFIIPYNKEEINFQKKYNNSDFVYLGFASGKWIDLKEFESHQRIYTFLIDFMHLLMNYNKNGSCEIEKMCDIIENLINQK